MEIGNGKYLASDGKIAPGAVKKKGPGSVEIRPEDGKDWPGGSKNGPGVVKIALGILEIGLGQ